MERKHFTRKELYNLVWSESLLSLSKKYAISDVGLRKICLKANIPLPKNGHWQKIKFGKRIKQPALPSNFDGKDEIILNLRTEEQKQLHGTISPLTLLQNEIENDLKDKLIVPEKLTKPDTLVINAKKSLTEQKADSWQYINTVSTHRDELDIRVAKSNISRALRFFDTLIKLLRMRGHDVVMRNGETNAKIEEETFEIQLREKMKKIIIPETHWNRTAYEPTGILSFQVNNYYSREWKDGKVTLEAQLSKILGYLEIIGRERKEQRIKSQIEAEKRKEEQRRREEYQKLKEKEVIDFKKALQKAERWHKANNLRSFIDSVETKAIENGSLNEEKLNWLQWARLKADWYDPFTESDDELLNEVDRDTLTSIKQASNFNW